MTVYLCSLVWVRAAPGDGGVGVRGHSAHCQWNASSCGNWQQYFCRGRRWTLVAPVTKRGESLRTRQGYWADTKDTSKDEGFRGSLDTTVRLQTENFSSFRSTTVWSSCNKAAALIIQKFLGTLQYGENKVSQWSEQRVIDVQTFLTLTMVWDLD